MFRKENGMLGESVEREARRFRSCLESLLTNKTKLWSIYWENTMEGYSIDVTIYHTKRV